MLFKLPVNVRIVVPKLRDHVDEGLECGCKSLFTVTSSTLRHPFASPHMAHFLAPLQIIFLPKLAPVAWATFFFDMPMFSAAVTIISRSALAVFELEDDRANFSDTMSKTAAPS